MLSGERDALKARLEAQGVETLIHYPVPIPRQPAVATEDPADCPVANRICNELLSLPLYPDMPRTRRSTRCSRRSAGWSAPGDGHRDIRRAGGNLE